MRGENHPQYKEKVRLTCQQCGKEFLVYPAWVRKGRKFCSRECKYKWQETHLKGEKNPNWKGGYKEKVCERCGRVFKVPRLRPWSLRRFCSDECRGIVRRREPWVCFNCGKKFWKKRSRKYQKHFCSKKCEGEYKRGENNPFYRGKFSEEALRKIIKARHTRPNRAERRLINLLEQFKLPFRYVGNGEVIIGGKNPDFIHTKGERKVIELLGIYWHSPLYGRVRPTMTYEAIIQHYAKHGYDCLAIWDVELKNAKRVAEKITRFIGGIKHAPLIMAE